MFVDRPCLRVASIFPGFPMKLPAPAKSFFVFPVALLAFCAPHVLGSLLVLAAVAFGTCVFDRVCKCVAIWLRAMIDNKPMKAPANLVSLGVILSVVFVVVGLSWDTTHVAHLKT